ncbi:MAG: M23 family metallopeptidase [Treponema sp.]|nr:M23 family metallopeptidase [Treponema sp.]MBR7079888.1 M23 family metallopeptidase [Treponema sp.]
MEIINYTQKNTYHNSIGLKKFFVGIKRRRPLYKSYETTTFTLPRHFTVKNAFLTAKSYFQICIRKVISFIPFMWIIPAAVASVCIPVKVVDTISYKESFATGISLVNDDISESAVLDNALALFAMNNDAYFDASGNVLDEDGNAVVPAITYMQPVSFQKYTVRSNDTVGGICYKFGLSKIDTIIGVNNIGNVRDLKVGQKLRIPSRDGLVHTVSSGETLDKLSSKYSVSVADLLDVNDLSSSTLSVGQEIFIPGARLDSDTLERAMGEVFRYPITASWRLTSKFGSRIDPISGVRKNHTGIDMACPTGTAIKAAMTGTVAFTGYNNTYGYYVIINHHDNYQTLYAHMSKILTKKGDRVSQGDKIGLVGSTGYSTGPHLHFTVYKNGSLVDPQTLLK